MGEGGGLAPLRLLSAFAEAEGLPFKGDRMRCPACDDDGMALAISETGEGLRLVCHSGCTREDVVGAIQRSAWGLDHPEDLIPLAGGILLDRVTALIDGSTVDSRLPDLDLPDPGLDLPGPVMTIANHLAVTNFVPKVLVFLDVGRNLGFDRRAEHPLRSLTQHLAERILGGIWT